MAHKVRVKGNMKGKGKKSTVKAKCVWGKASVRMGGGRRQISEDGCFFLRQWEHR